MITSIRSVSEILVLSVLVAAAAARTPDSESPAAEQELFRLTNQDRAQEGLAALQWNEWLAQAARKHAQEMANRRQLSHQFSGEPTLRDRLASSGVRFNASGENVAFGPSAEEINNDWMHSAGHRANILDRQYNAVGIAIVRSGNEFYAVSDFAHAVPELSSGDVEHAVAAAINQARAQRNLPALPRREDPQFRRYACEMAKNNRVSATGILGRPSVSASMAFTDADPANFVSHFRNVANIATARAFGVGACFATSGSYPEGMNWVVVAFY